MFVYFIPFFWLPHLANLTTTGDARRSTQGRRGNAIRRRTTEAPMTAAGTP